MKKCITALLLLFTLSVTSLLACTSADKPESATGKTSKTSKSINDKRTDLITVKIGRAHVRTPVTIRSFPEQPISDLWDQKLPFILIMKGLVIMS